MAKGYSALSSKPRKQQSLSNRRVIQKLELQLPVAGPGPVPDQLHEFTWATFKNRNIWTPSPEIPI